MFMNPQLLVKIRISPSLKFWSNLVPQLLDTMDLVLLINFC